MLAVYFLVLWAFEEIDWIGSSSRPVLNWFFFCFFGDWIFAGTVKASKNLRIYEFSEMWKKNQKIMDTCQFRAKIWFETSDTSLDYVILKIVLFQKTNSKFPWNF